MRYLTRSSGGPSMVQAVSVAEAARRLSVSIPHVYRAIYAGTLPSFRLGRCVRIPVAAIEALCRDRHGDVDVSEARS